MRRPKRLTTTAFSLLLASASPRVFAATLTKGPWAMTLDGTGPQVITYKGEPIIRRGALTGFLPEWKGGRFFMDGSQLTTTETTATWRKRVEGNQEATLKLELTPKGCKFSLDTTITAAGPSEYSVEIVPEAVRTDESLCLVWINGEPQFLDLSTSFTAINGIDEMRFERADRTVTVRCTGFQMQDRRREGGEMFLVQVIGSQGDEPRETCASIEIEVQEANPSLEEGRRVALSQKPRDVEDLPVANAGFESAKLLDSWTENPLAALDTATKHSGKQSTRLILREDVAKREHVYLIQNVPVREKGLYQAMAWIKSEQVEAAQVGGMSPTGATIIIEFADKQGKWMASGSYAGGLYGTTDWRWVATEVAQAPPGAGYAVIFLALRGIGTAWFDDVAVSEVKQHVFKLSPLPGQQIADNTPIFNWNYGWKTPATLELSQDESFPAGATVSVPKIESLPIALGKPIPPGKWFWRVRIPDHDVVSPGWEFTQTVALTQDTTEPKIEYSCGWLSKYQPMRVRYVDNVGVTRVRLTVDGREVSSPVRWSKSQASYVPKGGWTEGLHKALMQVADAAGNVAERKLFFTHSKPVPKTVWQQVGGVKTGGRKRFLFGMYGVRIQDMPEIAAGGFDFVHSYQWDGPGTNEEALRYLDAAKKNGLQAFIGIWRQQLMKGNEEFVAERVGALMSHPGLFAWYLYDEPDIQFQYVSPEWLNRYYKLIKALDPFHPVIVTCAGDSGVPLYKDALDVNWTQVYGNTTFVANRIDKHRSSLNSGTPLAAILHCYDAVQLALRTQGKRGNPTKFQPDGRVMRANAFMALAHNSSCLVWWEWGAGSPLQYTVANVPEEWASLKQTVADMKSLRPVLTAEGEIHTWIEKPVEGVEVHLWEKKLKDRTLIIAVNRDTVPCELSFAPKTLPKQCEVKVLFEDRQSVVRAGRLADRFEGLGVHVYEWTR